MRTEFTECIITQNLDPTKKNLEQKIVQVMT